MSLVSAIRDHTIKWLVGVVGGGVVAVAGWLFHDVFSNVVMKTDLESFAVMIGQEVHAEIKPLAEQTKANTTAICSGRKGDLRAAMRDLRVELDAMLDERGKSTWTNRDESLYVEWTEDLEAATDEHAGLGC